MICFKSVKYRNLLSTGNHFTEIQLDRSASTLVVGTNGGGKSTIIDAICYGLFGKPFRNIKLSQLINSINNKELEVVVTFLSGTNEYVVERGMKPSKFNIFLNGTLINQDAANKDYQKYLEENIMKLSYKMFTQMDILASAKYTPFMQLPAAYRREIIEDLLDISVFSKMNDVLKTKKMATRDAIVDIERAIEYAKMKLETQDKYIDTLKKDKANELTRKDDYILSTVNQIKILRETIANLKQSLVIQSENTQDVTLLQESLLKKEDKKNKLEEVKLQVLSKKDEYTKELLETVDSDKVKLLEEKLKEVATNINTLVDTVKNIDTQMTSLIVKNSAPIKTDELDELTNTINNNNREIGDIRDAIKLLEHKKNVLHKEVGFFSQNDKCPTCTMFIEEDFKKSAMLSRNMSIEEIDEEINKRNANIKSLSDSIETIKFKCKDIEDGIKKERKSAIDALDDKLDGHNTDLVKFKQEMATIKESIKEAKEEDNKEKKTKVEEMSFAFKDVNERISTVTSEINKLKGDIDRINKEAEDKKNKITNDINKLESDIENHQTYIARLEKEKLELSDNTSIDSEMIKKDEISNEIISLEKDYNNKHLDMQYIDTGLSMLKDDGIKTSIIKKYIPIINKTINSYLQTVDLFVQFELDETFNEVIKSRYRDTFSYESFSEGEKARIDVAILFAFRAVSRMKSTSSTNLLLLDETFDGSLDMNGADSVASILRTLEGTNVFCISHSEYMFDKFRSIIKFEKVNNFSVIKGK